jgi:hypothetical protein
MCEAEHSAHAITVHPRRQFLPGYSRELQIRGQKGHIWRTSRAVINVKMQSPERREYGGSPGPDPGCSRIAISAVVTIQSGHTVGPAASTFSESRVWVESGRTAARAAELVDTRAPRRGASQVSRIITTITSRYSSTTNAQSRARRILTLAPTNRVSQSGHLRAPATAMPQ